MRQTFYYTVLFALGFIATLGIFSEPDTALDNVRWFTVFFVTKAVGFAAGYAAYRILVRWEKQGKIQVLDDDEA